MCGCVCENECGSEDGHMCASKYGCMNVCVCSYGRWVGGVHVCMYECTHRHVCLSINHCIHAMLT